MSLLSDYRYRGVSLSDGKPAAQLALSYDDASGWYAGFFASTVRFATPSSRGAQTIYFLGYAHRTPSGLTIDAGADYALYTVGGGTYRYPEVYAGVAFENVSARLHYARRYYSGDSDTFYGELNGASAVNDRVRLLAHVGVLRTGRGNGYYPTPELVFDGRAGVAFDVDAFVVQIAWVGLSSAGAYPMASDRHRNGAVLSISRSF